MLIQNIMVYTHIFSLVFNKLLIIEKNFDIFFEMKGIYKFVALDNHIVIYPR